MYLMLNVRRGAKAKCYGSLEEGESASGSRDLERLCGGYLHQVLNHICQKPGRGGEERGK